jgi:Golgi phosphoprotein 3 GPP34
MSTARDLLIVTMDMPSTRPVERGDLSLALAGAELVDLLAAGVVGLERDRVVPGEPQRMGDRLLDEAGVQVSGEEPYEPVGEWLWRRGRGLAAAYLEELEAEGRLLRERQRRWGLFRTQQRVLVDSSERRRAASRWHAEEPVLADLATGIGITDPRGDDAPAVSDASVETVLTAVTEALGELSDERARRARKLDDATVDNYRRGY